MAKRVEIEVWASWRGFRSPVRMGLLSAALVRNREVFEFSYDDDWLQHPWVRKLSPELRFDPRLHSSHGPQHPPKDHSNFGMFLDSCPDRWGRTLLDRREERRARAEGRPKRTLRESDYLLGVFDEHRIGGLRFRLGPDAPFLDDDRALASPPWASLAELERISRRLEDRDVADDPSYQQWLQMLVAPGRSLGGARPKASVVDDQGCLWIAKFPSKSDDDDIGAWEWVVHALANKAGVITATAQTRRFASQHHTFLTKRFDRTDDGERLHFVSAMTQLGRMDGEADASYIELADVLIGQGSRPNQDLEQLWRRVVFNVCVSNVDDHLRNHGFLLEPTGWTLAPAYDMNPVAHGDGLALNISESDNALDLQLAREVAGLFRVGKQRAEAIITEVRDAVGTWRETAEVVGLDRAARERMAPAFRVGERGSPGAQSHRRRPR
ncbi:MAG: HipA domain-containing protein [Nannocystaceae bacterium]